MSLILSGTDGLSDVDGSASTPAIRGTDTNTGIFFPAADTIAFAEGGAEVMRINSSGNIGIGTASPNGKLDVAGTIMVSSTDGNSGGIISTSGEATLSNKLVLNGSRGSGGIVFQANSAEAMRIDSSGVVLLGTTNTNSTTEEGSRYFSASGAKYQVFTRTSNPPLSLCRLSSNGEIQQFFRDTTTVGTISVTGSSTAYNTSSDYRLKENVAPMTGALAKVQALKPCTYTWKEDGSDGQGFIAHELQEVCPDAVVGEKDAVDSEGNIKPQGIDTSFLVATLTAAIQELKAELDSVKAELATLKA